MLMCTGSFPTSTRFSDDFELEKASLSWRVYQAVKFAVVSRSAVTSKDNVYDEARM